jgi:hypothetical protein
MANPKARLESFRVTAGVRGGNRRSPLTSRCLRRAHRLPDRDAGRFAGHVIKSAACEGNRQPRLRRLARFRCPEGRNGVAGFVRARCCSWASAKSRPHCRSGDEGGAAPAVLTPGCPRRVARFASGGCWWSRSCRRPRPCPGTGRASRSCSALSRCVRSEDVAGRRVAV